MSILYPLDLKEKGKQESIVIQNL